MKLQCVWRGGYEITVRMARRVRNGGAYGEAGTKWRCVWRGGRGQPLLRHNGRWGNPLLRNGELQLKLRLIFRCIYICYTPPVLVAHRLSVRVRVFGVAHLKFVRVVFVCCRYSAGPSQDVKTDAKAIPQDPGVSSPGQVQFRT
jgi:hypothetical protein